MYLKTKQEGSARRSARCATAMNNTCTESRHTLKNIWHRKFRKPQRKSQTQVRRKKRTLMTENIENSKYKNIIKEKTKTNVNHCLSKPSVYFFVLLVSA